MKQIQVLVVGGGAAGFFSAIAAAEAGAGVHLLERGRQVLAKVKISGGGRCNVTHACFDPKRLVENYPRGGRELLGPFHRFQPSDTLAWFRSRGVELKTESDGRVFPTTDRSQTIMDALTRAAQQAQVQVVTSAFPLEIQREAKGFVVRQGTQVWRAQRLVLATGSAPQGHGWARAFGHSIVPPVPSLFTLKVADPRIRGLAGVSVEKAEVALEGTGFFQKGPVLVTHWGVSGPAILKMSAWAARELNTRGYRGTLRINWTGQSPERVLERLEILRREHPRQSVLSRPLPSLPQRLWERLGTAAEVGRDRRWADLTSVERTRWVRELTAGRYAVDGQGVFKEEFVTAGGVRLNEVNFSTMESRRCPGLYLAGEILDVDGLTGGFNFQSAWTTGWLAGRSAAGAP